MLHAQVYVPCKHTHKIDRSAAQMASRRMRILPCLFFFFPGTASLCLLAYLAGRTSSSSYLGYAEEDILSTCPGHVVPRRDILSSYTDISADALYYYTTSMAYVLPEVPACPYNVQISKVVRHLGKPLHS